MEEERARIRSSYPSNDVLFPLIEIIRTLDYHTFVLKAPGKLDPKDHALLLEKYKFGWALAFQLYYEDLNSENNIPLFSADKDQRDWIDQIVQHAGAIQIASQHLDYCKADLMTIAAEEENAFIFDYVHKNSGVEYYEKLSTEYYFTLVDGVLEEKKKGFVDKLPKMRTKLKSIVQLAHGKFITYKANDELDQFYSRLAYLYLMTKQIVDDFDESDTFGGIPYKKYMDHVEYVHRAALMHQDCCMALFYKTSHKVNLRDILTYAFSLKTFSISLGEYLEEDPEKLQQTVSCLTLSKDNFKYHLSYPGVSAPPYFQIGNDTLMRSTYGCLDRPVQFLNRELKRKYPTDFFNAVNNRERRFRNELYDFFDHEQIIRVDDCVIIKTQKGDTDIDGVLFDKKTNTLGLFQLKWQDSFSTSMKERFSRISNLIPKSVEWIEKASAWLGSNDPRTILSTLRISTEEMKIEEVYLFVVARHHVHFTNQVLDERAIWASWFQVLEASAKIKDPTKSNPIAELAAKLRFFSPDSRRVREQTPRPIEFEMRFSKYKIIVRNQKD